MLLHTGSDTANTWKSCNASQQVSRADKARRSVDYERRQLVRASRPIFRPFVSSMRRRLAKRSSPFHSKLWIDRTSIVTLRNILERFLRNFVSSSQEKFEEKRTHEKGREPRKFVRRKIGRGPVSKPT